MIRAVNIKKAIDLMFKGGRYKYKDPFVYVSIAQGIANNDAEVFYKLLKRFRIVY